MSPNDGPGRTVHVWPRNPPRPPARAAKPALSGRTMNDVGGGVDTKRQVRPQPASHRPTLGHRVNRRGPSGDTALTPDRPPTTAAPTPFTSGSPGSPGVARGRLGADLHAPASRPSRT